jgi:ketosteroid isomerase-like protein
MMRRPGFPALLSRIVLALRHPTSGMGPSPKTVYEIHLLIRGARCSMRRHQPTSPHKGERTVALVPYRSGVSSSTAIVTQFNEAISAGDLDTLGQLMSEDHRFVDSAGRPVEGRAACVDAWRSFFAAFPDYRNHFERIGSLDDVVVISGRSECSTPELAGAALWRAVLADGRIREWWVCDDSPEQRRVIGVWW